MQLSSALIGLFTIAMVPAGCGAATPQADSPGNDDDAAAPDNPMATNGWSTHKKADPEVGVTVKDESTKDSTTCEGSDIPDLLAILSQASCEVQNPKKDAPPRDLKDRLEIQVTPDSPKVASGSTAKVTIVFINKGKTPLGLDFTVDPEPRFEFELYTVKGSRADTPAGDAPPLPPEVMNAPVPDASVARVTLAPGGRAKLQETWNAVKYKWASKDKAKGALPGRGYPREPGNPLPKGKYVLRVVTPLVGVAEGVDHETSQPRVPIEVGNP
jgi:hypothetical protein